MPAMRTRLARLVEPLTLAALVTWTAVAVSMRFLQPEDQLLGWALLGTWLSAFVAQALMGINQDVRRRPVFIALLALELAVSLALIKLDPRVGAAQVLLVIWTAQVAVHSMRVAVAAMLVVDVVYYLLLRDAGYRSPLSVTVINLGFQMFAAICAYYAVSAEQARDRLARVNADLLATRALLADAARDAERLRVARELHDVAGHKLTAMTLNLRALAADPAFASRQEVAIAQQLSTELLSDIRGIVQAMRHDRGLDLGMALRALAAPMPRPSLRLHVADSVRVTDPATAEAVLRLVQEALTNSARHADADTVQVSLDCEGDRLRICVEDDGQLRGAIREGNGLSGMRERVAAAGGQLAFGRSERGSLRIDASLPA